MRQFALVIDGQLQADFRVYKTTTWAEKVRGLLWRSPLRNTAGLWLDSCSSVHTVFMTYNIDVIFMDKNGAIKKIVHAVKPWRMAFCWFGKNTLELLAGTAAAKKLHTGQILQCAPLLSALQEW